MRESIFSLLLAVILPFTFSAAAQEPYRVPPREVVDIVDAPPLPAASVDPTGQRMLLVEYDPMPPISYMAQPLLGLGGLRITPANNSRWRTVFYTGLVVKRLKDNETWRVILPEDIRLGKPQWSFDGRWIAFLKYSDTGAEVWVCGDESREPRPVTTPTVNAAVDAGFRWMPDSRHLVVSMIPEERGEKPERPSSPVGPNVQMTQGKFSKVRTYQDLLKDQYDDELFSYYMTSQIVEVDVVAGKTRSIGHPGIYSDITPSPDGNLLLVERIRKPYSHDVPYYRFARSVEIWDMEGNVMHVLAELPVTDQVPIGGVATGPRAVAWRPLVPAILVWAEALDGGDPEKEVLHRDRLMVLEYPFKGSPTELRRIKHRFSGIQWLPGGSEALLREYDWRRRWRTTYLIDVEKPDEPGKKIFDMSVSERYDNPGNPVQRVTGRGRHIIQDGDWVYLSGSGASPEGDHPFLDRMNIRTLEKQRLFQSGKTSYEQFYSFVGDSRNEIVTRHESQTDPPNFYLLNIESGERRSLTDIEDPAPQLRSIRKEMIKYRREDGVELSGTLYLPPGYENKERLPAVIWAYPLEYRDPSVAGQVRGSPNRFTTLYGASPLYFVTQGYAVLHRAKMPILGDPKTVNDTFVEQIVASARAAIDKLDSLGIVDRERVGIGGHSYGAFMTVNLLAHTDLFAAGVARSGAYNRTLTPFGFQSERRTLWEAPEAYFRFSPLLHADRIEEPLLLIHGEIDSNAGTYPIQSERLFHALKGHGSTARLVMMPHEGHNYMARESILHVLAEMIEWFDRYVKKKT